MGLLSRKCTPLLRKAGGKRHASSNDHEPDPISVVSDDDDYTRTTAKRKSNTAPAEKGMPTPTGTNSNSSSQNAQPETVDLADPYADPISDESLSEVNVSEESIAKRGKSGWKRSAGMVDMVGPDKGAFLGAKFKMPRSLDVASSNKRTSISDEIEPDFMMEYNRRVHKRPKIGGQPETSHNIHARQTTLIKPKVTVGYGKQMKRRQDSTKQEFKHTKKIVSPEKSPMTFKPTSAAKDTGPKFKMATLNLGRREDQFQKLDDYVEPLSEEEDGPDSEDGQPEHDNSSIECTFCGQHVDKLLKEDFEDNHNRGKERTYKWQRRFCDYHRRDEASNVWRAKGYPEIDWSGLEGRMRKHDAFLIDVLNDDEPSHYRTALKGKLRPRKRGFEQVMADENSGRPGASVGYYGPRGEKLMIEHVVDSMSDTLRQQAAKDKLVASSGVQGGVSGFMQSVLVPHLAELLIKDDMKLKGLNWASQAREIIAESAELGELIHPDFEDEIVQIDEDDDD